MAADDRTALLEELPAAATKQLLTLLAPEERAVALSLLGYPAGNIGRLNTSFARRYRFLLLCSGDPDYLRLVKVLASTQCSNGSAAQRPLLGPPVRHQDGYGRRKSSALARRDFRVEARGPWQAHAESR